MFGQQFSRKGFVKDWGVEKRIVGQRVTAPSSLQTDCFSRSAAEINSYHLLPLLCSALKKRQCHIVISILYDAAASSPDSGKNTKNSQFLPGKPVIQAI